MANALLHHIDLLLKATKRHHPHDHKQLEHFKGWVFNQNFSDHEYKSIAEKIQLLDVSLSSKERMNELFNRTGNNIGWCEPFYFLPKVFNHVVSLIHKGEATPNNYHKLSPSSGRDDYRLTIGEVDFKVEMKHVEGGLKYEVCTKHTHTRNWKMFHFEEGKTTKARRMLVKAALYHLRDQSGTFVELSTGGGKLLHSMGFMHMIHAIAVEEMEPVWRVHKCTVGHDYSFSPRLLKLRV